VCEVLITSRSSSFRGVMFAYYIGLVAHNMYPILAVYQRIFNQIIQIVHWLVDSDLFWAVWWKPRDSTANGWKWRCIKLCAFFFWTTLYLTQSQIWISFNYIFHCCNWTMNVNQVICLLTYYYCYNNVIKLKTYGLSVCWRRLRTLNVVFLSILLGKRTHLWWCGQFYMNACNIYLRLNVVYKNDKSRLSLYL